MKDRRQQVIRRLVLGQTVSNQHELQDLLRAEGFEATQATLSRDLADLGVLKGPDGYRLPGSPERTAPSPSRLEQALRRELLFITAGGTTVVIRTPTGHGNALAVELDAARLPGALGTIAGDDTIFLAATGPAAARRLATQLARLAGLDGAHARSHATHATHATHGKASVHSGTANGVSPTSRGSSRRGNA